jgi:hypothetical protein
VMKEEYYGKGSTDVNGSFEQVKRSLEDLKSRMQRLTTWAVEVYDEGKHLDFLLFLGDHK